MPGVGGVAPSPQGLLGERHREQPWGGGRSQVTLLEWMRKESFISLFIFGSGSRRRPQGEGGPWPGVVGFQRGSQSGTECHVPMHFSSGVKGDPRNPGFVFW